MPLLKLAPGTRVHRTMGVRQSGTVLPHAVHRIDWTDGTYRYPEWSHERPVWVRWDDGTAGWTHREALNAEGGTE